MLSYSVTCFNAFKTIPIQLLYLHSIIKKHRELFNTISDHTPPCKNSTVHDTFFAGDCLESCSNYL